MIDEIKPDCDLEVDGGIDAATTPLVVEAGANVLVAGSAIFGSREGVAAAMQRLGAGANQKRTEKTQNSKSEIRTNLDDQKDKK
jgi:ribulose-phosphate 3-epimerase